ncbi:MAG: EAL domain-containing protein [Gammaproteobacteria bacterium]|nr:EAL domain-containing protein [Gammaproteobacteria bacterium]
MIYSAVPMSLVAVLLNSSILSAMLWNVVSPVLNLGWLGATFAVSLYRWAMFRRFCAVPRERQDTHHWWPRLAAGTLASGLVWGTTSVLLFTEDSMLHQLFLAFVIAGMSAGAVSTLSASFPLAAGFLGLTLLPMTWRFALTGGAIGYVMAFMSGLYCIVVTVSALRLNRTIVESLQIRHERRMAEETIRHQAHYDALTDLPNRRMLLEQLGREMARSVRHGHIGAVLFLDLDHFKTINDSLGHRVGDQLLKLVAKRIVERVRREDTASRLGGDEFVILVPEVAEKPGNATNNAHRIADEIIQLFRDPFSVQGHELHLSASIGVALFPFEQKNPEDLLQQADVAMYSAKERGRDNVQLFIPSMQAVVDQRLNIERGLRQAIDNDELELFYQPQVVENGRIIGAEALLRWHHRQQGTISPTQFIGVAEETGLIYKLGDWVLRRACEQLAQLGRSYGIRISVNISPKQFRESGFVERLQRVLEETGAPPELLTLEITESLVIDNIEQTIERMRTLKSLGISFSLDDFGTGHSSLAYLKRLPLDAIKIDQSFVRDITTDPNDAVIVETIIVMSQHLGLQAVAEGVESDEALQFLQRKGCRQFQGYLFGRPEPFEQLQLRLHKWLQAYAS